MAGYFAYGYYAIGSIAVVPPPAPKPSGAEDLMGALKALWDGDAACVAAAPGGWHTNEAGITAYYPYVTARRSSGLLKRRSSTTYVDDVQVRIRVWSNELGNARIEANLIEALFDSVDGLLWTDGWSTRLERVDRTEDKAAGRAPGSNGLLRTVDLLFLTHCGREVAP